MKSRWRGMLKLGCKGSILQGPHIGWQIFVEDDSANTGGYLILYCEDFSLKTRQGFDDWVENLEQLEGYFQETKLVVEWEK